MENKNNRKLSPTRTDPRDTKGAQLRFIADVKKSMPAGKLLSTKTLSNKLQNTSAYQNIIHP